MDVKLPKLGEGTEGGSVVSILVKEGDTVSKGQTILELENEKAVAPIPSPAAGVVGKIRVKEGERVLVGAVLMTVEEAGGAKAAPAPTTPAAARPVRSKGASMAIKAPMMPPQVRAPLSRERS